MTKAPLYQQMRATVAQWVELSPRQWETFASLFRVVTSEKHEHVLLPGSVDHRMFFIAKGLLRVYTLGNDGRESNKGFIAENVFAGPLAAFMLGLPSL